MVILLDRSGSMKDPGGDPEGLSRAAVEFLVDQLELASDANQAALVLFSSKIQTFPEKGVSSNFDEIRSGLANLSEVKGNTDLEEALQAALLMLSGAEGRKQIVLVSDGKPEPDESSARVEDRFPEEMAQFRRGKVNRKQFLERLSEVSAERIAALQAPVLGESRIEVFPLALSGIPAKGEDLLKMLASEVTRDPKAYLKIMGKNLVAGLDAIVPKPLTLMNVGRVNFNEGGKRNWSTSFIADTSLARLRILILYGESPPGDLSWEISGPAGRFSAASPGSGRYLQSRKNNGRGDPLFERIFLDAPPGGRYQLDFVTSRFLPPITVVVEGRTHLKVTVSSKPTPAEAGSPVQLYCGLEGGAAPGLQGAKARILNDRGDRVAENLSFVKSADGILRY